MSDIDNPEDRTAGMAPSIAGKGGSPWLQGFVAELVGGGLVVLLVGGGLATWPPLRDRILGNPAAIRSRVDELSRQLQASSAGDEALAQRIAKIETATRDPASDPRLAGLAQRADQLSTQLDAVKRALPPEGSMVSLAARVEEALQATRDIAAKRQSTASLLLVIGQLRDAVERGDPYQPEMRATRIVAGTDEAAPLDILATHAAEGIKRRQTMLDSFPAMAEEAFRASFLPEESNKFWRRIEHAAANLINVQRTDGTGQDVSSILSRARTQIKRGDIAASLREMSALTGASAEASKGWVADATAWVAAQRALSQIESDLTAKVARE